MKKIILGISAFNHDSSATLIIDGDLVGFAEEERYSEQKKHWCVASRGNQ